MFSKIPHDPASDFIYVLVLVSIFFIWKAGRSKPDSSEEKR